MTLIVLLAPLLASVFVLGRHFGQHELYSDPFMRAIRAVRTKMQPNKNYVLLFVCRGPEPQHVELRGWTEDP
jgi:hypothetical protein